MKTLIIYFSQTDNTRKIARAIREGIKKSAGQCDIVSLKKARYDDLKDYDLIGIGSPIWFAEPPNLTLWIDGLPDQNGKQAFFFSTHGTLPLLYAPIMSRKLTMKYFTVIGWNDWYGGYISDAPAWYTDGHPDEIDLKEAEDFGKKMVENSQKISVGDRKMIPALPEMPAVSFQVLDLLLRAVQKVPGYNVHGVFAYDRAKCNYPKCHICVDNCPMGYIDFSTEPRKYGQEGDKCATPCTFCEMICPTGAIKRIADGMNSIYQTEAKRLEDIARVEGKNAFIAGIDEAEAQGKFRYLVDKSKIGPPMHTGPKDVKHPRYKIPKEESD
jgi:flavodoxin/NAD-dependent dihydropyrimidine dehydrogenase PreA subunit